MQGETRLIFPASHPVFAGHFPGQPIVPGVMLLDAVIHAIVQNSSVPGLAEHNPTALCQISSAKFLSPVSPDENLTLTWNSTGGAQVRFDISGPGRQVATGVLGFNGPP